MKMANHSPRMRRLHRLLLSLIFLDSLVAASSSEPRSSPSADVELICHATNSAECYPKVFQPRADFQIVHEDQDLPPGLHVRLNMATGLKEAKINVPGESDPALEGLPVDNSVVLVDKEAAAEEIPIPANAPAYDPAGKIKEPQNESGDFYKSLSILKKDLNVDDALEMLEDISHDIYYGLKISEDFHSLRKLFCLANTGDIYAEGQDASVVASRARLAALTIASTTMNNPKALAEIEKHWPALQKETCPKVDQSSPPEKLSTAVFRLIGAKPGDRNDPALAKARVSAISGLIRSPVIRKDFLDNGGMELLLEVLVRSEYPQWEPARRKAGLLVLDNFLDENMGATLGEWPTRRQLPDSLCEKTIEAVDGGCWDWWAKKLAYENKRDKSHWTQELWTKLQEQRRANGDEPRAKKEL